MSHQPGIEQSSTALHAQMQAPSKPATQRVAITGRAALVFRPAERLHLGTLLHLTTPLARLAADRFPRTVLLMDYGFGGSRPGVCGLTDAALDRLACLPPSSSYHIAVASQVPAIARLAAVVASQLVPTHNTPGTDARSWFADVLLAAGLVATRATHAVVEAGGAEQHALTRKLVAALEKVMPGACPQPLPAIAGLTEFRALDGSGAMGASPRGTLYINDTPDQIVRKVRSAKTDTYPCFDPSREMSPEVCNLLLLLHALSGETVGSLMRRLAGRGYAALKDELAAAAVAFLEPIRRRREELLAGERELSLAIRGGSRDLDATASELADTFMVQPELLVA